MRHLFCILILMIEKERTCQIKKVVIEMSAQPFFFFGYHIPHKEAHTHIVKPCVYGRRNRRPLVLSNYIISFNAIHDRDIIVNVRDIQRATNTQKLFLASQLLDNCLLIPFFIILSSSQEIYVFNIPSLIVFNKHKKPI